MYFIIYKLHLTKAVNNNTKQTCPHPWGTQQLVSGAACCTWMRGSA